MDNRIREIRVRDGQLIPAQAEVWISVVPENQTPMSDLRGRLMGPRCPYSNTVEVAYPLGKPPPSQVPPGQPQLTRRVVIPEACLWEPESPFLYQGPIELWQDGRCCDQVTLSHGLRYVILGKDGLRLNSHPLMLQGRTPSACTDEELLALRQEGCNLLIVPIKEETLSVWDRSDNLGFFVLGRILDNCERTRRYLSMLNGHASCLGWLIKEGKHPPLETLPPEGLIGFDGDTTPPERYLRWIDFLFGPLELANPGTPLLAKGDGPAEPLTATLSLGSVL